MLTKPADEDSDDDEQMQQATAAAQNTSAADAAVAHGATVSPPSGSYASPSPSPSPAPAPAGSRDSLSAGLSNMSINNNSLQSFGELDKLRDRQRVELLRSNTSRGLPTPGIYGDLQGLNWDPLQAPMAPQHAVETRDTYSQGNLSDYSDYT